ncbi:MAG: MFS transporter [Actinomycetales bacterium]|nr:MFS transporter [Actinomycetales bacterium]
MFVMILLVAFESLAVTTAMPTVAEALDGTALYQLAFVGAIATGIVGMVVGGAWSDRSSPRVPLTLACAAFAVGLAVAGLAQSMEVLVVGRLVQGLGGGAINVCLYVIVGRLYPGILHPRIFAAFSSAWVLPSIVGPLVAGLLTEHLSWRWVFLGAAALTVPVWFALQPGLRRLEDVDGTAAPGSAGRLVRAVVVSVAMLGLGLCSQLAAPVSWLVAAACMIVTLVAVRGLLPAGTLRIVRGLPAVVADRSFVNGAFFGAQVYIPYLLTVHYGFSPTTAGIGLTTAALTWSAAAWVQGRLGMRLSHRRAVQIGTVLVATAIGLVLAAVVLLDAPVPVVVASTLGGAGMGFVFARLSVLTLHYSEPGNQGANTAALSIADSFGSSASIAVSALVFAAAGAIGGGATPFVAALAFTFALALVGAALAGRVAQRS